MCSLLRLQKTPAFLILHNLRSHPWRVTRSLKPSSLFTESPSSLLLPLQTSTVIEYVISKVIILCLIVSAPFTFSNWHEQKVDCCIYLVDFKVAFKSHQMFEMTFPLFRIVQLIWHVYHMVQLSGVPMLHIWRVEKNCPNLRPVMFHLLLCLSIIVTFIRLIYQN